MHPSIEISLLALFNTSAPGHQQSLLADQTSRWGLTRSAAPGAGSTDSTGLVGELGAAGVAAAFQEQEGVGALAAGGGEAEGAARGAGRAEAGGGQVEGAHAGVAEQGAGASGAVGQAGLAAASGVHVLSSLAPADP